VSKKSSQRQLGDGSSPFYKNESSEFSATCEVSKYLETNAGILKDRLAKNLNMHFGTCRKGWIMTARQVARVVSKTSQLALNCLGLFVERT
jgi:hypothetical protein